MVINLPDAERDRIMSEIKAIFDAGERPANNELCRRLGISEHALCSYKAKLGLLGLVSTRPQHYIAKLQERHQQLLAQVKEAYEVNPCLIAEDLADRLRLSVGCIYRFRHELGLTKLSPKEVKQRDYQIRHCQHGSTRDQCRVCWLETQTERRKTQRRRENASACIGF